MSSKVSMQGRRWADFLGTLHEMNGAHVKAGALADKGGGEQPEGSDLTIAEIGALHEYGDPESGLPERSYVRKTFIDKAPQLATFTTKLTRSVLAGKMDVARALDLLGAWAAGAIKATITSGNVGGPPLSEATIKAKGSSKKLIDTGQLVNSITWEVVA